MASSARSRYSDAVILIGQPVRVADLQTSSGADIDALAMDLLDAFEERRTIPLPTSWFPEFDTEAAYAVLDRIDEHRRKRGWRPAGWKIGFTNRGLWPLYRVDRPMWASVWNETVVHAVGSASVSVGQFVQPRLEPEIVLGLRGPVPLVDDPVEIVQAVEWVAPGFEIVQCLFRDWRFTAPDCTAAFGLHGGLVVGEAVASDHFRPVELALSLAQLEVALSRDGEIVDRGSGSNVLGSPLLALSHLARGLAERGVTLNAGDIVTTGTLTDAWPLEPDSSWRATYLGMPFGALALAVA